MWIQAHTSSHHLWSEKFITLATRLTLVLSPDSTGKKKSQLDENKHMLFVKLKLPAKSHKVSPMSRPFRFGFNQTSAVLMAVHAESLQTQ